MTNCVILLVKFHLYYYYYSLNIFCALLYFSSVTGEGVAFLQSFIAYLSGQLEVKALSGEAETQ